MAGVELIASPQGRYRFLPGIAPYSAGVVAMAGHELVHVTMRPAPPWRAGFEAIEAHLASAGRERTALAAVQLRSPAVRTFGTFSDFNDHYTAVLRSWGVYVDGLNPIARTNVVPEVGPPPTTVVHAFSYVVPCDAPRGATFMVAGAGELRGARLDPDSIVARGDTSDAGLRTKATFVMEVMDERRRRLGVRWADVTAIAVYTAHPVASLVRDVVLPATGGHGVTWYVARPPVEDLEFEMDVRGVRTELAITPA